jgi:transformation/transcription domain-associated protein
LPKDLLQAGLKPILVNLSDHKRLTVPALEGLARLLELLTNYFKVAEIGRKLLDHLRQWAEPSVLENAAGKPLSEVEEIKIVVAILDVFHLLPPSANIFMEELITVILELERSLRRCISSPFRQPLIKYLNRYPAETIEYFLGKVNEPQSIQLFLHILSFESAAAVRSELIANTENFLSATFQQTESENSSTLAMIGVFAVYACSKFNSEWITEQSVISALKNRWLELKSSHLTELNQLREYHELLELLMIICKQGPLDVDVLFEITESMVSDYVIDISFLKVFFFDIAHHFDVIQKKSVFEKFFDFFESSSVSQTSKSNALRYMLIPMLIISSMNGEISEIVDSSIISSMHKRIWHPFLVSLDSFFS